MEGLDCWGHATTEHPEESTADEGEEICRSEEAEDARGVSHRPSTDGRRGGKRVHSVPRDRAGGGDRECQQSADRLGEVPDRHDVVSEVMLPLAPLGVWRCSLPQAAVDTGSPGGPRQLCGSNSSTRELGCSWMRMMTYAPRWTARRASPRCTRD